MDLATFLDELRGQRAYRGQVVYEHRIPARGARYANLRHPLPPRLRESLSRQGIRRLYEHQVAAIEAVRDGRNVVVVTGTASGKTLCFNLPVLEAILEDPRARALYLYPTKALAQDQLDALHEFGLPEVRFGTYDGDTPQEQRKAIRETAHIVLTNPDMLHLGILPQHRLWSGFLRHLRFVVIDDMHIYRGVFGSHVANVIRRLRRVLRFYGANPVFILTSATIANPGEFAEKLLGLPTEVIDEDASPRGPKRILLWNPPFLDRAKSLRRSPYSEANWLFTQLVRRGIRTIAFTKARKTTELLYRYARFDLLEDAPELARRISPYRAGYLPEERREIERRLFTGELIGVVSTSALELGIDVGGLDAAILVGYPGTIASTWQRVGRVGRGRKEALVFLVALQDALDQYLMRHPQYLFERPCENAVIDPQNPYILLGHLRCAARELPIWESDFDLFGPQALEIVALLEERGELIRRDGRWYWRGLGYPAQEIEIRTVSGDRFRIKEIGRNRVIGTVDAARAFEEVHPGAIYLHQGEPYVVRKLDLLEKVAYVAPARGDYYTQPRVLTDVEIKRELQRKPWGPTQVHFGEVEVTSQVIGYVRKQLFTEEVLGEEPLDLPAQVLRTTALWFEIPKELEERVMRGEFDLAGGIHAVEHAAIGLLPLFAMCDRWDIGGVSYPLHPQTELPTIFIYDGYPGGVGFAQKGYELLDSLMEATLRTIEECACEDGCPSCIQSPKCGNMNRPLDKATAIFLLKSLIGRPSARVARGAQR